jgi:hypothetical protein
MKCIGAQSVDATALTAPQLVVQTQCRRSGGAVEHRTFVSNTTTNFALTPSSQLPLFEESQAEARR